MDASDLYFVARYLLAAARRTIVPQADGQLSGTERLVLEDLVESAPTSVVDIARRTQIAQSRVSAIIATWRGRGAINVSLDPKDRRRTLVEPSDGLKAQYLTGALASADHVFDQLGVPLNADDRARIYAALDVLHKRLRPDHG